MGKASYAGGYTIVKDLVREIKCENSRIAYLRFETEPGRQAQVDFEDFKVVEADRDVMAFCREKSRRIHGTTRERGV